MAGLLEYTKNGQVTEPPLYRFMRGNVQSFLNSIPDPSKMTPEQQLSMGLNANPIMGLLGTTAYHGSPYLFNKFDINKVGSGEGAQAFGHGIYFAENPEIAKEYAKSNIGRAVVNEGGIDNLPPGAQVEAYKLLQSKLPDDMKQIKLNELSKKLTPEQSSFIQSQMNRGNFYKVDIPDEYMPKMLDWDKPLGEQNLPIKDLLSQFKGDRLGRMTAYAKNDDVPAGSFYRALTDELGSQEKATKALQKAGISGVKYLDATSRDLGQGTRNFVVFDPSEVKILEKGLLK